MNSCSESGYAKRDYYGAVLELPDKIWSGAGQSEEAFEAYINAVGENNGPTIYMLYCGLDTDPTEWLQKHKAIMDGYGRQFIPQIGLSMTHDSDKHYEKKVADGVYDENINRFISVLQEWNLPVFVRIGYEFNGHWNGYEPREYIRAFQRIRNKLKDSGLNNIATVWCYGYDDKKESNFMNYYPGDEYVDWWGIDLFQVEEFNNSEVKSFLAQSVLHKKPLIIGESTPRHVGVLHGGESWDKWFKTYFDLIKRQTNLKAFCYINWDWSAYPQWSDWGDCRIEMNDIVRERFIHEMENPIYQHTIIK